MIQATATATHWKPSIRKWMRGALLTAGGLIVAVEVPILLGIVTPGPKFEWLKQPALSSAAVTFVLGGVLLSDREGSRLLVFILFAAAVAETLYLSARFFGV